MKQQGFTLLEVLVVLAIFGILLVSSAVVLGNLRGDSDLQAETRALARQLELARSRTIASEGAARYGVYVDTSATPHEYTLFQGDDYASRDSALDEIRVLRNTVEFSLVSFTGATPEEAVFDRIQGTTSQGGSAVLREKANPANARAVYVESSGAVTIDTSTVPNDNDRVKDSRHMHVYYTRMIDKVVEDIVLDFDSGVHIETIPIADHLSGGQIVWEGTVDVGGEEQTIKIHTHELNNGFDSQFSIHRDRRPNMNTKSLTIKVPGTVADPDNGTLIAYDAAGVITPGTSVYVTSASTTPQ
ncbi:MAG TPA: type II secretion system protein [Candidatus Paceibacterota bacterium]